MKSPAEQQGPLTSFERNTYAFILTVILGLFGAEIYHDYTPVKLTVLFFLAAWPLLLVVHEGGHAVMAALLGWRVRGVVIGLGRVVWSFRVAGVPVQLRLIPVGGFALPAPRDLRSPRLKMALIYLAGPGAELLLLAGLVAIFGPSLFLTHSEDLRVLALQAFAVAAVYGAITNLIPVTVQCGNGRAASDGMGFLRSFFMPDEAFLAMMNSDDPLAEEEALAEQEEDDYGDR